MTDNSELANYREDAAIIKTQAARIKLLTETLQRASDHLDYCGYGDNWERECAGTLEADIEEVLSCP
jgi:hypothetical protein